jgi:hypothetical protein
MQPFATHKEPINSTRLTLARQDADQIQAELARAQLKFIQDQLTAHFMADVYPLLAPVVPGLPSSEIVAAEFGDTQIEILIANKGKGAGSILLYNTKSVTEPIYCWPTNRVRNSLFASRKKAIRPLQPARQPAVTAR